MTFNAAIVGRPNVGKSTLFNRLVGKKLALVDDTPGVTRDRREGLARLGTLQFSIMDTAGFEDAKAETLAGRMRLQTEEAVRQADIVLFVIDARAGLTPLDEKFAALLRRFNKPVMLIANKAEGKQALNNALETYSLGFGNPLPLSAEHGDGFSELFDRLFEKFPESEKLEDDVEELVEEGGALRLAVIGRPNAGKSTLINHLIGEERLLTGPEAGITRDAITIDWKWKGKAVKLFDTAGIRRKARVQTKLEKLAVTDGLRAVQFAHVVVLLIDVESPLDKQDLQLADLALQEGRVLLIGINKWDTIENGPAKRKELEENLARFLPQVKKLKLVTLSGLTGKGVERLLQNAFELYTVWSRRVPTSPLNRWFEKAISKNPPPAASGRRLKLNYVTQVAMRPPTFACFGSRPDAVPESYRRYLLNSLSEAFDMQSIPLRLHFRGKGKNPYEGRAKKIR
ncbi:MAG: ribosome biogenesis GTPase Der [Pseudomonadota bacterium]